MGVLDEILAIHKKTVLIGGNGFAVDCVLKPASGDSGYSLKGFAAFIGLTFNEADMGHFGDAFELTIDINDLKELTNLIPARSWFVEVKFPQMNGKTVTFKIEDVAIDRTIGVYLIKCSVSGSYGGMKVKRQLSGGM